MNVDEIRTAVESGTIKGEEANITKGGGGTWSDPYPLLRKPGRYLVIPVSDGGSET